MNDWIECNLPWSVRLDSPETVPYPDMDDKVRAHFGYSESEWTEKCYPGLGNGFLMMHPIMQEDDRIREELNSQFSEEEVKEKLKLSDNSAVQTGLAWAKTRREMNAWIEAQPEMIAAIEENDRRWVKHQEEESRISFCGQGLNKAGTVIEYEDDGKMIQMVIGHINELGGCCDDCMGISKDTVILRYKTIWNGECHAQQNARH